MPVGPFIFRVMTDRPRGHGGGAGQARHRDQLSVNVARSRHMTFLRWGSRSHSIASMPITVCAECICTDPCGRARSISFRHVMIASCAIWPSAVAISIEKKRDFPKTAARHLTMPSHITQQNQPPAARPTALLLSRPRFLLLFQTLTDTEFLR